MELAALVLVAFAAGLIDSIAGGGGLLQVPGLYVVLGDGIPALVFGTNKGSSVAGTAVATLRYARAGTMPWREVSPAAVVALPFALAGAAAVSALSPSILRPVVLVMLFAVFVFTVRKPDVGRAAVEVPRSTAIVRSLALGASLGFYDGFFGPGTGAFLMFGFVRGLGLDFLRATAGAKLVNLVTNLASLALFALNGHVRWDLAIPMGAANIAGAVLGTKLAILKGAPLVRHSFIAVVVALLTKLAWDALRM